jgi:hypothetical protein
MKTLALVVIYPLYVLLAPFAGLFVYLGGIVYNLKGKR